MRTGIGLRKKGIFRVYTVASYIEQGAEVKTAAELAASDQAKQLHLVFERGVAGAEIAQAFQSVFRRNYPEPAFKEEMQKLTDILRQTSVRRGDQLWITHIPQVGMQCRRPGNEDVVIENVEFSKALWDNYLGKYNISEDLKRGLVAELGR
jgi:hypothetical protein